MLYFSLFLPCWFYKYYYNEIYNNFAKLSYISVTKYLDKGFFEYFGPYGLYKIFYSLYYNLNYNFYNIFSISIFIMVIGMSLILIFMFIFSVASNIFIILLKYTGIIPICYIFVYVTDKN
jgi:hypothetical protein